MIYNTHTHTYTHLEKIKSKKPVTVIWEDRSLNIKKLTFNISLYDLNFCPVNILFYIKGC